MGASVLKNGRTGAYDVGELVRPYQNPVSNPKTLVAQHCSAATGIASVLTSRWISLKPHHHAINSKPTWRLISSFGSFAPASLLAIPHPIGHVFSLYHMVSQCGAASTGERPPSAQTASCYTVNSDPSCDGTKRVGNPNFATNSRHFLRFWHDFRLWGV